MRDNGAVLRHPNQNMKRVRPLDNKWTFGKPNKKMYLHIGRIPIHRIVATAYYGEPECPDMVVDHIDTNHQNNRPINLRWVTRYDNVVNNPITVAKILYRYGSIDEFWKYVSKKKGNFYVDYSWMRPILNSEIARRKQASIEFVAETNMGTRYDKKKHVENKNLPKKEYQESVNTYQPRSQEELDSYAEPISALQWADDYKKSPYEEELRLEEEKRKQEQFQREQKQMEERNEIRQLSHDERVKLGIAKPDVQSLNNPIAMQRDWTTPAKFYFCPTTIGEDPIREYAKQIQIGELFSNGIYDNYVIEYSVNTSGTFLVLKSHIVPSGEKYDAKAEHHAYGVMEISVENGRYIHNVHRVQYYQDEWDDLYNSVVEDCENE